MVSDSKALQGRGGEDVSAGKGVQRGGCSPRGQVEDLAKGRIQG